MDTLAKKKHVRQRIQNKLKSQQREIDDLKRRLRQMGGVHVDRDGRGTIIRVEMRIDNYAARDYAQIWNYLMVNIACQLGSAVATEQAKQAFSNQLKMPKELAEVKRDWLYLVARNHYVPYEVLDSAWESALDAIKKTYQNQ